MSATQPPVRHATGKDGSYLWARCHAQRGEDIFATQTFSLVTCERCLYIIDVETRAQDLKAAISFGEAAILAVRGHLSEDAVREAACVAAHFGFRLFEEVAA